MYHNIANPPAEAGLKGLYVCPSMFRFQMWYLKIAGFTVVPLHEIAGLTERDLSGKKIAALTFDDGYEDFYTNAFPVLGRYGYPATVFVVSGLAGSINAWDEKALSIRKRLMGWDRIKELAAFKNVFFGSHTITHPFLTKIGKKQAEAEIFGSKQAIEDRIGSPVETFCYPYGDCNGAVKELVREAGYKIAVTTNRGEVRPGDDPLLLRRVLIRRNSHPLNFMLKMHTGHEERKGLRGK